MNTDMVRWNRLALITELAERMDKRPGEFGHTAVMKFLYLLQTLKDVPLGYNFTLYSYGPYDASVLDDLSYAASVDAVKDKLIHYPNSYGYDIKPGDSASQVKNKAPEFLESNQDKFTWVVEKFAKASASELELISTIIYADQELQRKKQSLSLMNFVLRVRKIKPHFTEEQVKKRTKEAQQEEMLHAVGKD